MRREKGDLPPSVGWDPALSPAMAATPSICSRGSTRPGILSGAAARDVQDAALALETLPRRRDEGVRPSRSAGWPTSFDCDTSWGWRCAPYTCTMTAKMQLALCSPCFSMYFSQCIQW